MMNEDFITTRFIVEFGGEENPRVYEHTTYHTVARKDIPEIFEGICDMLYTAMKGETSGTIRVGNIVVNLSSALSASVVVIHQIDGVREIFPRC